MQLLPVASPGDPTRPVAPGPASSDDEAARAAAEAFEATFLAEMLRHTGLNANPESFGGGIGEDAFGSLLTDEYARLLAGRGGIGLAERIFDVIKQGESGS